jgi:hypothetical protein
MPKYIAHIVERVERTLELEAATPEEALALARDRLGLFDDWDLKGTESDNGLTIIDGETNKPVLHEADVLDESDEG